jgi:hypothetical protein
MQMASPVNHCIAFTLLIAAVVFNPCRAIAFFRGKGNCGTSLTAFQATIIDQLYSKVRLVLRLKLLVMIHKALYSD